MKSLRVGGCLKCSCVLASCPRDRLEGSLAGTFRTCEGDRVSGQFESGNTLGPANVLAPRLPFASPKLKRRDNVTCFPKREKCYDTGMIDEAQDLVLGEIHAKKDYFTQEGVLEFFPKT